MKPFNYNHVADSSWDNGIELKVTAILKPKADLNYGSLSSGFYYTSELIEEVLELSKNSRIVNYINQQLETNPDAKDSITSGEMVIKDAQGNITQTMATGITYTYDYKLDSTSEMFFVESRKNGSCGLKIEKPFIMRNDDNTYTDEYNKIILDVRK
jgi:hypothetical protein